jgi:lysine 2,3-aminomutase
MGFITELPDLSKRLFKEKGIVLTKKETKEIGKVVLKYPMQISDHYFSLIEEKGDPIWNQCVPSIEELHSRGEEDPLDENNEMGLLTHRYPDRCLFLVSGECAMYCRFCTRKRKFGCNKKEITLEEINKGLDYIKENNGIRDVLLSGGDPLLLSTGNLEDIIKKLREIKHVEMIRIGTRVPCVYPERVDQDLCDMLHRYRSGPPIFINTHFEHPTEINERSKNACEMLIDSGIPMGNQSVVLRDVNDDPIIFKELNKKLLEIRVRPYYLYQADLTKGTYHFACPIEKGREIIRFLRGHTTGMACPQYVIDSPGGKIPVDLGYTKIGKAGEVLMKNYEGRRFRYPKIQEHE